MDVASLLPSLLDARRDVPDDVLNPLRQGFELRLGRLHRALDLLCPLVQVVQLVQHELERERVTFAEWKGSSLWIFFDFVRGFHHVGTWRWVFDCCKRRGVRADAGIVAWIGRGRGLGASGMLLVAYGAQGEYRG